MDYLTARRARVAKAWALSDEVVLVPAGTPIEIPGTDQEYPFRAHPEHRYLADLREAARYAPGVATLDADLVERAAEAARRFVAGLA